jgi:hypothetical protein
MVGWFEGFGCWAGWDEVIGENLLSNTSLAS